MLFKTLRHRAYSDTYGDIYNGEVWPDPTPVLWPPTVTKESLIAIHSKGKPHLRTQIEEYELIDVQLIEPSQPIKTTSNGNKTKKAIEEANCQKETSTVSQG
jgi:hypothetical protein